MNETFHIPISDESEGYANPEDDWGSLADPFDDNEFARRTQEIAGRNTFDPDEAGVEKTEEEKKYELEERSLAEKLEKISEKEVKYLAQAGEEYAKTFADFKDSRGESIGETFSRLSDITKDGKSLKALLALVDLKYPSPFEKENSDLLNPFTDEMKKIEDLKDDYRRSIMDESGSAADSIEGLSKVFMADGSQSDYYVGNTLRNFGNSQVEVENKFSNALINYIEDPSEENKSKLNHAQSDREGLISNDIFNIAGTLDESRTRIGGRLFDTTVALAAQLVKTSEDNYDGILDYIKFKMQGPEKTD